MVIRRATRHDAWAIAEVAQAGWRWAYTGILPEETFQLMDVAAAAGRLRDFIEGGGLIFVSGEGGKVAGFASVEPHPRFAKCDIEIGGLYVQPSESRRGMGRLLVSAVARYGIENRLTVLGIHTLRDNVIGRSFYEKLGGKLAAEDLWRHRGADYPAVWYLYDDLARLAAIAGEHGAEARS